MTPSSISPSPEVVLGIRGTLAPDDALTDVTGNVVPYRGGWVHDGMMRSARFVVDSTLPAIKDAITRLTGLGTTLLVAGHSLGAGVASTVAMLLRDEIAPQHADWFPQFQCVAAAPPSIVTEDLAVEARNCVLSVVCGQDMIPRTSPANVDLLIHEVVTNSNRRKIHEAVSPESAKARERELEGLLIKDGKEKHYPPGNLLLIHKSCEENSPVSFMQPTDFDRILNHDEMTGDHLISRYEDGLLHAVQDAEQRAENRFAGLPKI
jgi:hypothetical protein